MTFVAIALRVVAVWFCFGMTLGLLWTAACYTSRVVFRLRAARIGEPARGLLPTLLQPFAKFETALRGEPFSAALAVPALAMPRRFRQGFVPPRETILRPPLAVKARTRA